MAGGHPGAAQALPPAGLTDLAAESRGLTQPLALCIPLALSPKHTKVAMAGRCAHPDNVRPNPTLGSYYYIPYGHTGDRAMPDRHLLAAYRYPPSVFYRPEDSYGVSPMFRIPRPMFSPRTSIGPVVGIDHCCRATSVLIHSHLVIV